MDEQTVAYSRGEAALCSEEQTLFTSWYIQQGGISTALSQMLKSR